MTAPPRPAWIDDIKARLNLPLFGMLVRGVKMRRKTVLDAITYIEWLEQQLECREKQLKLANQQRKELEARQ